MIHDELQNLWRYLPEEYRGQIMAYMQTASSESPEEKTEIYEGAVFSRVMSYPTKLAEAATVEAHNVYVDIQFTLVGAEGISVFPRGMLEETGGSPEDDFYSYAPGNAPVAWVANLPGYFAMLFPHEAHRPQESIDGMCATVKKGVIKIRADCFSELPKEGNR